jgi:hypothetical protein
MGEGCLIPLKDGAFAKVDQGDYARVMQHKWVKVRPKREAFKVRMLIPHAQTKGRLVPGIALHRFILGAADGDYIRFRNKDGLDCRRKNLWVIYRTKPEPRIPQVKITDRPKELPSPCGGMLSAKSMTRCHGFLPGTMRDSVYFDVAGVLLFKGPDGCPYYEQCLDAAAREHWNGWRSVHGKVSTAQWAETDDGMQACLKIWKGRRR